MGSCVICAKKPSENCFCNSTTMLLDLTDFFQDQRIHASEGSGESGKLVHKVTFNLDTATVAQVLNLQTHPKEPLSN